MSTSRKARGISAAGPQESRKGKGMSGSDDGSTKIVTGGDPPRDQAPGASKGPDKKKQSAKG